MKDTFTVLVDSREQNPFTWTSNVQVEIVGLRTGDYTLKGAEELLCIERKSLDDLCQCVTGERDRFKAELQRMRAYRARAVLVEANLSDILAKRYRSRVEPQSVTGSIASWTNRYSVPFLLCGDHEGAAAMCLALMRTFHQQCVEFAKAFDVLDVLDEAKRIAVADGGSSTPKIAADFI